MAQQPKMNRRRDRGPITRMFDTFTVAVFVIVAFVSVLAFTYVLTNGEYEPTGVPSSYWFR